jgi:hypothetical protein
VIFPPFTLAEFVIWALRGEKVFVNAPSFLGSFCHSSSKPFKSHHTIKLSNQTMAPIGSVLLAPSPSSGAKYDFMYYLKAAAAGGICCSVTHGALTPVDGKSLLCVVTVTLPMHNTKYFSLNKNNIVILNSTSLKIFSCKNPCST